MSTSAQISANQANAQRSTGPRTAAGKAAASQNHFSHGLSGALFTVLPWEDQNAFNELHAHLEIEHNPATPTEELLVRKLAEHHWLAQRALKLQDSCFDLELTPEAHEKQLALYIRYQTTHDRAFHKSLDQLLKLRAEKRKAQIGFESQKRREADYARRLAAEEERKRLRQAREERDTAAHLRREAAEKRKQDMHQWDLLLRQAELDHQHSKTNMMRMEKIADLLENEAAEPVRPQQAA